MTLKTTFTLSNGVSIPNIGFGTWQIDNGEAAFNAVTDALKTGYRHIDTANDYENESSVGEAIRASNIPRGEIFVTSKLPAEEKDVTSAKSSFEQTMKSLDIDYLDLYLIHAPWPWEKMGDDYSEENKKLWKFFEEIYEAGHVRAIGVSNFNALDVKSIMEGCTHIPMVNQIKFFIGNPQDKTVNYCQNHGILVEAYSPLSTGAIFDNEDVLKMAQRYDVSVAQVCVQYILQKGILPLPKTVNVERMKENLSGRFSISKDDMKFLDSLKETVPQKFRSKPETFTV